MALSSKQTQAILHGKSRVDVVKDSIQAKYGAKLAKMANTTGTTLPVANSSNSWNQKNEDAFNTVDSYTNWATDSSLGKTTNPPPVSQDAYNSAVSTANVSSSTLNDSYANIMNNFNNQIGGYKTQINDSQSKYDSMQRSLDQQKVDYEKKIKDLQDQFAYKNSQIAGLSSNANARDGVHLFNAGVTNPNPTSGVPVGFTQGGNAINDSLYRYLNNIWNGGF